MDVVPAGVHNARIVRGEVQAAFLGDRQAVDIGAQTDARTVVLALNQADNTGFQRAVEHFNTE